MKKLLPAFLLAISLLFSNCATIFTGSRQNVLIKSIPPEAEVEVDGISRGVTPVSINLKKGFTGQTIILKKQGFDNKIFQPETTFNPVSIINLLFIIGWGVDAATGAMMKYEPRAYEMKLTPLTTTPPLTTATPLTTPKQ